MVIGPHRNASENIEAIVPYIDIASEYRKTAGLIFYCMGTIRHEQSCATIGTDHGVSFIPKDSDRERIIDIGLKIIQVRTSGSYSVERQTSEFVCNMTVVIFIGMNCPESFDDSGAIKEAAVCCHAVRFDTALLLFECPFHVVIVESTGG